MSKERAARLKLILAKMQQDSNLPDDKAADEAVIGLLGEGLNNLARIADALEKIAAPPEAMVGEAIKFEPQGWTPEQREIITDALKRLGARHGHQEASGLAVTDD